MNLPPLRTVRDSSPPPAGPIAQPAVAAAVRTPVIVQGLENPRLPQAGRAFLVELVERGLLDADAVAPFLAKLGDRASQLDSRDRTGEILAGHGLLTRYQRDRALTAQYHGLTFGPYRVLERLGGGSLGPVFLAEHAFLKRKVAVKVLPADDTVPAAVRERFAVEARILAGLSHPHVIEVYDAGVIPAEPGLAPLCYAVLELAAGGDVEHFVYANGTQPVPVACEWGRQAAAGLRAIHDAGLVHRDVKPSNLVLTETRRVKLVDFGLAREFASTRTPHRIVLGSLDFLAPEQLADAATAGPAADVYGLGVTLFWVLTGQLPRPSLKTAAAAVEAHRSGATKRLREVHPSAPAELDALFARLLAKNPGERPTAGEAVAAFAAFAAPSLLPEVQSAGESETERLRAAVEQLERAFLAKSADAVAARSAVLSALASVASVRPGESPAHQRRVAGYVRLLAARLAAAGGWPMFADPGYVDALAAAAAAHDVGMVGVPDDLLALPEPETQEQYDRLASHTVKGAELLEALAARHGPALPFLRVARDVVRYHHERWDGNGYPDKLAADAIPPAARLVAVAVAYDDLRRTGPGREGLTHAAAATRIRTGAGTIFDSAVVRAFAESDAGFDEIFTADQDDATQPEPPPPPDAPPPAAA